MTEVNIPILQEGSFKNKTDKVLLFAGAGLGKSTAVATVFIDAPEDRRVIYLMLEPNAAHGIEFGLKHYNINLKPGQLIYAMPGETVTNGFGNLSRALQAFTTKPQSVKHSPTDMTVNKDKYGFLQKVIDGLNSFKGIDYITGESVSIGDVGKLKKTDILVIDGLSPIASEVWKTLYGDVLLFSGFDYGAPQQLLYSILSTLTNLSCGIILLAHEKEYSEGEGLTPTLKYVGPDIKVGNANFESMMGLFTDVFRAKKVGKDYKWEGAGAKVYLINRKLPKEMSLEPNFSKYGFFQEEK